MILRVRISIDRATYSVQLHRATHSCAQQLYTCKSTSSATCISHANDMSVFVGGVELCDVFASNSDRVGFHLTRQAAEELC